MFTRVSDSEHQAKLDSACRWLGIERGRAILYGKLLKEFGEDGKRSREHILSYAESFEIIDLFDLWQLGIDKFPGLREKVKAALIKGPLVREDERPAVSSNRARNDAFVFLIAGTFLKAGTAVHAVEGISARNAMCASRADFTFECKETLVDVECKRPRTKGALGARVKEARKQLGRSGGRQGVIALDCSVLVRPAGHLLEADSPEVGESRISSLLEELVPQILPCLTASMLGSVLFARVPMMKRAFNGDQRFARICISSWLIVENSNYSGDPEVLHCMTRRLGDAVRTS